LILWTHILEEYALRGLGLPAMSGRDEVLLPKASWLRAPRAADAIKEKQLISGNYLVKYGGEYLRETLKTGRIRLGPAASYGDPSLNPAIRDDELEISLELLPSETSMHLVDKSTGQKKNEIHPTGNVTAKYRSDTDYYVYCLSSVYDFRLYDDFTATCCLIITNPKEFISRLIRRFVEQFPGWDGWGDSVVYIDPLNPSRRGVTVFFNKHFRFAYQKEYRVVFIHPSAKNLLDPIFLELGSLENFAELIVL